MQNGFDFDRIFVTTHDAVLHILSVYRPEVHIVYDDEQQARAENEGAEYFRINILKQNNFDAKADQDEYFTYSF